MTAATHYAFSYLLLSAAGFEHGTALVSSVIALLPDVDHPDSLIGRVFGPLSQYIQKRFGHRTVTHSVFAIIAIILFLSVLSLIYYLQVGKFPTWFGALSLAFASHIFIDLFNRSGVRLFAPVSNKEYISFRTPELRILVNSWQEYVLLFFIVFFAFSISNKPFSLHSAVRSIGKHFYKTYDSALKDFQENASYECMATLTYFDEYARIKRTVTLPVVAMNTTKAVFIHNSDRLLLRKENIDEIVINKSLNLSKTLALKGSDIAQLSRKGFYLGTITLYNYLPDNIKSSDFVEIEKYSDHTVFKLFCATSQDISFLLNIDTLIKNEISLLTTKLVSTQIAKLKEEELHLKKRLAILKSDFYGNYGQITKLANELKSVQTRIKTLEMQAAVDQDAEIRQKIEQLQKANIWYDIVVLSI